MLSAITAVENDRLNNSDKVKPIYISFHTEMICIFFSTAQISLVFFFVAYRTSYIGV